MSTLVDRPTPEPPDDRSIRTRIGDHVSDPLAAGSYALLSSSLATGLLGLGYWVIAARAYDPADLGRASAVLATVMLATNLVSAGFKRGLLRFLPGAGSATGTLLARTYAAAIAASLVGSTAVAVAGVWWTLPGWDDVQDPWVLVVTLAAIPIWTIFTLQDAVLIALGRPWLVPSVNLAFSIAKLALVLLLAPLGAAAGVIGSWAIPALVAVVAVSLHLARALKHAPPKANGAVTPTTAEMLSFTGAEHLAVVMWRTANLLMPVIVLARVDPAAAAGFYLADQVTYGLNLISSNVTDSAVAVASGADEAGLRRSFRSASRLVGVLVGPAVAVLVVLAGPIMGVFGESYRSDTTTLLVLLALAAVPNAVTTLVIGLAHVRRRLRPVVAMQALMAFGTLAGSWLLIGSRGLSGVGLAYLLTQTAVAVVALIIVRRLSTPGSPVPPTVIA